MCVRVRVYVTVFLWDTSSFLAGLLYDQCFCFVYISWENWWFDCLSLVFLLKTCSQFKWFNHTCVQSTLRIVAWNGWMKEGTLFAKVSATQAIVDPHISWLKYSWRITYSNAIRSISSHSLFTTSAWIMEICALSNLPC